jgi:hypothetical protein
MPGLLGLVGALLHPDASIRRQAHQVHGPRGDAQHTHGAALDGAQPLAMGVAHRQLLVAPRAALALGAQGLRQQVQRRGDGVGRHIEVPRPFTRMLLIQ